MVEWAEHHDDHEFATGDIATPIQRVIGMEAIRSLQERWDIAICGALGIAVPTDDVRRHLTEVDAIALVMVWHWLLCRDPAELGVNVDVVTVAMGSADLLYEAF